MRRQTPISIFSYPNSAPYQLRVLPFYCASSGPPLLLQGFHRFLHCFLATLVLVALSISSWALFDVVGSEPPLNLQAVDKMQLTQKVSNTAKTVTVGNRVRSLDKEMGRVRKAGDRNLNAEIFIFFLYRPISVLHTSIDSQAVTPCASILQDVLSLLSFRKNRLNRCGQ